MSGFYNVKNYTEQGGEVTHIGGRLVFDEGAEMEGFPGAVNLEPATGSQVKDIREAHNALLVVLKNAGLMTPDAWELSALACPTPSAMPTEETAENSGHATLTVEDEVIHIVLDCKVEELSDADHGETWGVHKWLGFGVRTGLDAVTGIRFTDDTEVSVVLGDSDAAEATALGLSAGDFVLYVKAEDPKYLTGEKSFALWADGYQETTFVMLIEEPADVEDDSEDVDPENAG